MKQKLILEIEAPDHLRGLPSMEEIKRAISRGFYEYFGNWVAQNIELKLSSAEDKPLISNVLPFTKIILDHTEDKGFHLAEEQIENEKFPLRLQGIAWERAYESEDEREYIEEIQGK